MTFYGQQHSAMMSGDGPNIGSVNIQGNAHPPTGQESYFCRLFCEPTTDSPLKIFVQAKQRINSIYKEMNEYVMETVAFIKKLSEEDCIVSEDKQHLISVYWSKVKGIKDVISRNHMKVVFFGRTSNGKSTVINAMLHDKILPSGLGHTTNCFLQVEGCDSKEAFLTTEDSNEKKNVESVSQLAHALCEGNLGESSLVSIFWPKQKCSLLRDDVVFVDSPGIDVSPDLDSWIDKYCLDADVFVLVANAESTLMVTEKNFFHKVSERLSKPNIFILENRWDASASETEYLDEVRKQHTDKAVNFLVNELKVCSKQEAENRVFFISAKEVLQARLQQQKGFPPHTAAMYDGFQKRFFEFHDFEVKFEECISRSAVKTKFEQHTFGGKLICSDVKALLCSITEGIQQILEDKKQKKQEILKVKEETEEHLTRITTEMKEKITQLVEDVEQKVSNTLGEEIKRLSHLANEFNSTFSSEPYVLSVYKKEINQYVERGLGDNLRAKLSSSLAVSMQSVQKDMTEKMMALLPDEKKRLLFSWIPKKEPFEVFYRLNCENLCADFQEDINFCFTFSLKNLIIRLMNKTTCNLSLTDSTSASRPRSSLETVSSSNYSSNTQAVDTYQDWSFLSKIAVATISSQGIVGGVLITGMLVKTIGWKFFAMTSALYGLLYFYERLMWTNSAKERLFKKQYVNHATSKLRLIVDLISVNCSHQVQQELSSSFARLCHLVDESTDELNKASLNVDKEIQFVEETYLNTKKLQNRAFYLHSKLDVFEQQFLKH